MKKILGGSEEEDGSSGTGCGVNMYNTHGVKMDETRGLSKAEAMESAERWNAEEKANCESECGAYATWCCSSC
ncbi:hypothetical protein FBD94_22870 [Pedobacter hiemivivus]|uniref:Uncharacterized protein n=1 Tax=Pedobacter hiemivivus TaxID=2530454 RepID=A0A4U1G219_9SPHI|nr:hypothetical protein [Pedobacter hiemivivus]TKC56560.1 hypothetical protein FBD94_22870 [Pedobacter hiemivivus]